MSDWHKPIKVLKLLSFPSPLSDQMTGTTSSLCHLNQLCSRLEKTYGWFMDRLSQHLWCHSYTKMCKDINNLNTNRDLKHHDRIWRYVEKSTLHLHRDTGGSEEVSDTSVLRKSTLIPELNCKDLNMGFRFSHNFPICMTSVFLPPKPWTETMNYRSRIWRNKEWSRHFTLLIYNWLHTFYD